MALHAARRQPARSALPRACHPCAWFFGAVPFVVGHAVISPRVATSRLCHSHCPLSEGESRCSLGATRSGYATARCADSRLCLSSDEG